MSLRSFLLVGLLAMGCGGSTQSNEPTTAKEKLRREAKASGEDDGHGKQWGGWRYQGERNDCFFTTGRKCFKTENEACQAARCRAPKKCRSAGAAPTTVSCS